MAIAITEDFVTKSGLIVQGTGTVTSSTGQTTALQVNGGAAVAKNLIVGSTTTVYGPLDVFNTARVYNTLTSYDSIVENNELVNNNLRVNGNTLVAALTATGKVSITNTTAATTTTGALVVTGGISVGNNLVVSSSLSDTGTVSSNALYVAGGVGIDKTLVVSGESLFKGNVTFVGSSTFLYSVNDSFTDNLIELHVPPPPTSIWTVDDGKDIGLRFQYFDGLNRNAALVLANDTKYLEWYNSGAESNTGTFTGATYGTFKTGAIKLVNGTTSTGISSGDLTVAGGVGIGQNLYVATTVTSPLFIGNLTGIATTATNLNNGSTGSLPYQSTSGSTVFLPIGSVGNVLTVIAGLPAWTPLQKIVVDYANTATNLKYGDDQQIPYQIGEGQTSFEYNFRYDYNANTLRTVNAVFTGTTNATSTDTGSLQVVGGIGVGADIYVGNNASIENDLIVNNNVIVSGFIEANGDIITNSTTFDLLNTTATTINFGGSATTITIGSSSGYTNIRNQTKITNITASTSTDTGSLIVSGGVGIGGNLYVTNETHVRGNIVPDLNGITLGTYQHPFQDLYLSPNSLNIGDVKLSNTGTTLQIIGQPGGIPGLNGDLIAGAATFTTSTDSYSTNTGGLQVVGGAGIGKSLYVGGSEIIKGNLRVDGGTFGSTNSSFNLLNTTATTINFAGAATAITIGSNTGFTTIRNQTTITNTTNSLDTTTGALVVSGGLGVGSDLYVGGNENINGNLEVNGGNFTTVASSFNLLNKNTGTISFAGSATSLIIGSLSTNSNIEIRSKTAITNFTPSANTYTGALVIGGGVGIGDNLYVEKDIYSRGSIVITSSTIAGFGVTIIVAGTDTAVSTSTGEVTVWNTSTLQSVTSRGNTTNRSISITDTTQSTSAITGALKISGGVGIARQVNIGGVTTVLNATNASSTDTGALVVLGGVGVNRDIYLGGTMYGIATTATNIQNGTQGQIPFQVNPNVTGFFGPGTDGQLLVSRGTTPAGPIFVNTSSIAVGFAVDIIGGSAGSILYQSQSNNTEFIGIGSNDTFLRSNGSTATFVTTGSMYVGRATITDNVAGGASGGLLYQTGTNQTGSLPIGPSGWLLNSDGSNPAWVPLTGLSAGTATNISITNETSSNATHYITFLNTTTGAGGIRTAAPSGLIYIPGTGYVGVGVSTPSVKLDVAGGAKFTGDITITTTTNSISTTTGSLVVGGGIGLGSNLYVGGHSSVESYLTVGGNGSYGGTLAVNGNQLTTINGSFDLVNTNAVTVNFAGAATTLNIGAATGNTTIRNDLTISGNLIVQGTSTTVDSTSTNIADPIITIGGLANNADPIVDDNKDRGIAFKWHNGANSRTGFFGFQDNTGYFVFLSSATIANEVVSYNGGTTKGVVDANIAGGTIGSLVYQSSPNNTSFLASGISGYVLESTGLLSAPRWSPTSSFTAGSATTSTNLKNGNIAQIPYQTAPGITSFIGTGTVGQLLVSQGSTSTGPVFVSTSSILVGNATTATHLNFGNPGQIPYQSAIGRTTFTTTGTTGQVLISQGATGPIFTDTTFLVAGNAVFAQTSNTSTNIAAGVKGNIPIQKDIGLTSYIATGTNGSILQYSGFTATWISTSTLEVGYSTTATNLLSGSTGTLVYQINVGVTGYTGAGSKGQILISQGSTSTGPVFASTASFVVGYSVTSTNIAGGVWGSIPFQKGSGQTGLLAPGTAGFVLSTQGLNQDPVWITSSGLSAGNAVTATNLLSGQPGQIPYQANSGITNFFGPGTAGTVLVSSGGGINTPPVFQNTLTLAGVTSSTNTTTGALQVRGGVGVGGSVYVGNRVGFVNASNVSTVYQYYNAATNSLDTVFG